MGWAASIVEKVHRSCGDSGADLERSFSRDELLTNVMLYWVTGTIESSFQPYRDVVSSAGLRWMAEAARAVRGAAKTPAGFALFPKDDLQSPAGLGGTVLRREAVDRAATGRTFRGTGGARASGREIRSFFRPLLRRTH